MSFLDAFDFTGKTILIAGASSGIGRETAIQLSELNSKIILLARREKQLKETINMLTGSCHKFYSADLTELDKIESLVKMIVAENEPLSGLVYCAGIAETIPLKATTPQRSEYTMKINCLAFCEMVRQFVKKGNYSDNAKIVGISSLAVRTREKGKMIYAASKSAMEVAVQAIAKEIAHKNISINTIRPAFVRTVIYDIFVNSTDNGYDYISGLQPLGIIEPYEVASLITYLLSPCANRISGSTFEISAGI